MNAAVYRVYRFLICSKTSYSLAKEFGLEFFIQRTILRGDCLEAEELQIVKLLRHVCMNSDTFDCVSSEIFAILKSKALEVDCKFRLFYIETLCEMSVTFPSVVSNYGILKLLLNLLIDGPMEIIPSIVLSISHLIDSPESRKFFRPQVDLEVKLLPNF